MVCIKFEISLSYGSAKRYPIIPGQLAHRDPNTTRRNLFTRKNSLSTKTSSYCSYAGKNPIAGFLTTCTATQRERLLSSLVKQKWGFLDPLPLTRRAQGVLPPGPIIQLNGSISYLLPGDPNKSV